MADDDDNPSSVVLEGSRCWTLQHLVIGAERRAEGNVDAAGHVASAEAGCREVKGHFNHYLEFDETFREKKSI